MIPAEVINVVLSDQGFLILLKSTEDNRVLPISIGKEEARSILIALSNTQPPRPLTHDLMKTVFDEISCTIERIEVCDLRDETFYGKLILNNNGVPLEIDSRPSDAIALAVRAQTPIFVANHVFEEAGVILKEEDSEQIAADQQQHVEETETPQHGQSDAEMSSVDMLKKKLRHAIENEEYEEAARIRDQIHKITSSN
ncbi:MAG: bifunctional nuclease domain-containing protein [Fibrobacterota bacterium]